jgi:hypothetical protein
METIVFLLIVLLAVWLATQLVNMLFANNPEGQRVGVIIVLVVALIAVLQHFSVVRF